MHRQSSMQKVIAVIAAQNFHSNAEAETNISVRLMHDQISQALVGCEGDKYIAANLTTLLVSHRHNPCSEFMPSTC